MKKKRKRCSKVRESDCKRRLLDGRRVFEACQETCSQYASINRRQDWVDCVRNPIEPTTTPPGSVICSDVQVVEFYLKTKKKQCSKVGKNICKRQLVGGGRVFEACQERCSKYPSIVDRDDWVGCINKSIEPAATRNQNNIFSRTQL